MGKAWSAAVVILPAWRRAIADGNGDKSPAVGFALERGRRWGWGCGTRHVHGGVMAGPIECVRRHSGPMDIDGDLIDLPPVIK
ncbi:hypothetical protein BHE74_00055026 [Ensete ventricosum]|uniref:Uncharacterized protein n=1 Tax=Ensete ventricosum TaxID=4639 RepID=A0A444BU75_ENSVE|nr:hypothetical protein GW17_00062034 [Ensete ventricosum]RWW39644.1 hypothetical protein BHE74_00055026 [Ensete ventricosum]RZR72453.1 hypothetical protein BHM03_00013598 [Ensete ventricosum]